MPTLIKGNALGQKVANKLANKLVNKLPPKIRSLFINTEDNIGKSKPALRASKAANPDWRCKLSWHGLEDAAIYGEIFTNLPGGNTVIWPYTPQFDINYQASYELVKTVQTNYATPAYQGSEISNITIAGQFSANNVAEANYLYAVIHFLKSATKGYNAEVGATSLKTGHPPPILKLTYLGQGGIRAMPVLMQQFNVSYPQDVDYIRTDLNSSKSAKDGAASASFTKKSDGTIVGINLDSINGYIPPPSMVPSEMNINITLIPAYTRADMVSAEYSTSKFIRGELIDKGYF